MTDRASVIDAIEASWSQQTSGTPDDWSAANPAKGHCDVSSFVAWEHLGGELVLGQVHVDGAFQEHHYWNRIDGVDLDLTRSQFSGDETITEHSVLDSDDLAANQASMRPELRARIAEFRAAVTAALDRP